MATMRKWYVEGLVDPEYATNTRKIIDTKFTSNQGSILRRYRMGLCRLYAGHAG